MERVSDAERLRVIEELRGHCAAGRLSMEEYAQRVEEVMAATTVTDLGRARRELPFLRIPEPAVTPRASPARFLLKGVVSLTALAVVAVAVLVLTSHWAWTAVLVAGWLLGLAQARVLSGRRRQLPPHTG